MATGFFKRLILGTGLTGTDNGDDTITLDADTSVDVLTTKGDILTQDPSGTYIRVPIGATGTVPEVVAGLPAWVARIKTICKQGSTALTGAVELLGGANVTLTQTGQVIEIAATVVGSGVVDSVAAAGDTPMIGDIEIAGGAGVTVTQDDVDTITIAAVAGPGGSELVYRYTVVGSDKATIDTGVDTPDAGSNNWTNGDCLEVFVYARTDESVVASFINWKVNNDGSAIYDTQRLSGISASTSAAALAAQTSWIASVPGASNGASVFGMMRLFFPDYLGTVGYKIADLTGGWADTTLGNSAYSIRMCSFRSTAAVSRLAITPVTAAKKFKVGTTIAIYKRLAS